MHPGVSFIERRMTMQDRDIKRLRYEIEYYGDAWWFIKWTAIASFFVWVGTKL